MHRSVALFWLFFILGAVAVGGPMFSIIHQWDPISYFREDGQYLVRRDFQFHAVAGLLATEDYDGVIVGSSLSSNFDPGIFERGFGLQHVANASIFGATVTDRLAVARKAVRDQKGLKVVFFGLKPMSEDRACSGHSARFPGYLYDRNPFNDIFYFVSAEMLAVSNIKSTGGGDYFSTDRQQVNRWLEAQAAHIATSVERLNDRIARVIHKKVEHRSSDLADWTMSELGRREFGCAKEAIYNLVADNPGVRFIFFEPPSHIAQMWRSFALPGQTDKSDNPLIRKALIEMLEPLPNFEYHDFSTRLTDMSSLCGGFMDPSHFLPVISDQLQRDIVSGRSRLRAKDVSMRFKEMMETLREPELCKEAS